LILKLAIIGVILVVGGIILYPELTKTSIVNSSGLDAVAEDLDELKDTTVQRVNYEVDRTIDTVGDKIEQIAPDPDEINPIKKIQEKVAVPQPEQEVYYGEVYEKDEQNNCKISVPKMAKTVNGIKELTHTVTLPDCQYQERQSVQISITTDPQTSTQTVSVNPTPQTQVFETLQLTTMRTDDNTVGIHYEDTSGKTLKVTVTLRNSEKQLFAGEFFASKFDTNVNDVSTSPHIIEMVVEHADYGTVTSSVFNPQGNDEATIYGVFTK
jgi:hypothetical protein